MILIRLLRTLIKAFETQFHKSKLNEIPYSKSCGESRIRTCEVLTADLQSALVGRLSISPNHISIKKEPAEGLEPTTC
jgi:hypothetical protein